MPPVSSSAQVYEIPEENPVQRMQSRMLRHKQKLTDDPSAQLDEAEQRKAEEMAAMPDPDDRMDALLDWVSEHDTVLTKERIAAATRTEIKSSTEEKGTLEELEKRIRFLEGKLSEDILTGAYNRRYLDHELPKALEQVNRSRMAFEKGEEDAEKDRVDISLLFIDIDHFKAINDELGHNFGDEAIKALCTIVSDTLRDGDTLTRWNREEEEESDNPRGKDALTRWGGEEFIVILKGTSKEAQAAAERIRKTVEAHFKKLLEPHCQNDEQRRILDEEIDGTVSIGIATYSPENKEIKPIDLIAMADAAMYRAKEGGRNTVKVYNPETDQDVAAESTKKRA